MSYPELKNFNMQQIFGVKRPSIIILTKQTLQKFSKQQLSQIAEILNIMGAASQKAQGLPQQITSIDYIVKHCHIVILLVNESEPLGIHKVGLKHLFQYNRQGQSIELDAFCSLDFYVNEKYQRKGLGKLLFEIAEQILQVNAKYWAIDRPSTKMFAFFKKYYNIDLKTNYEQQVSKFAMHEEGISVMGNTFQQIKTDSRLNRLKVNYDNLAYAEDDFGSYLQKTDLIRHYINKGDVVLSPMFDFNVDYKIELESMDLDSWTNWFLMQTRSNIKQPLQKSQVEDNISIVKNYPQQQPVQPRVVSSTRQQPKTGFW